jgi:hypothetical protein
VIHSYQGFTTLHLGWITLVYALSKTSPRNLVGKKGRERVHHMRQLCCPCCLIKNLAWENPVGKDSPRKKSTTVDLQEQVSRTSIYYLDLQDLLIFKTGLWSLGPQFWAMTLGSLLPGPYNFLKSSHALPIDTSMKARGRQRLCEQICYIFTVLSL